MLPRIARPLPLVLCLLLALPAVANPGGVALSSWFALPPPDQSDWSGKRISKYAELANHDLGEPMAVIRVPSLSVAAPVYPDSEPMALEAGAAWVTGTAGPGRAGNVAIAGHRDSFFRPLENIPISTRIELSTANLQQTFEVSSVRIVDALDISPLDPSDEAQLTLITCHPFRYQGFAPDRYIIRARLLEEPLTGDRPGLVDSRIQTGQTTNTEKGDS